MRDIRNLAGKLVCRFDEDVGVIEIRRNGYRTLLRLWPKTQALLFVTNTKHIRRH